MNQQLRAGPPGPGADPRVPHSTPPFPPAVRGRRGGGRANCACATRAPLSLATLAAPAQVGVSRAWPGRSARAPGPHPQLPASCSLSPPRLAPAPALQGPCPSSQTPAAFSSSSARARAGSEWWRRWPGPCHAEALFRQDGAAGVPRFQLGGPGEARGGNGLAAPSSKGRSPPPPSRSRPRAARAPPAPRVPRAPPGEDFAACWRCPAAGVEDSGGRETGDPVSGLSPPPSCLRSCKAGEGKGGRPASREPKVFHGQ
ncbi:basic proline-rich protein-like [Piliocolobus tephrosceles]|uniref:basic proline-rich protein-like n=1 Tax=Piliocolobus tephrosceles TaxID=591936 RepID=UPI000C2A075A|nr:basic proline-rich protein-like [Piliocolobus tephrosceles]